MLRRMTATTSMSAAARLLNSQSYKGLYCSLVLPSSTAKALASDSDQAAASDMAPFGSLPVPDPHST